MNKPRVSVLIPTHNSEKYIIDALNSVINQTLDGIEVICIDSSVDDTPLILKKYCDEYPYFNVIYDENSSYGHKMNVGIEAANGDYIAVLESDDMFTGNMLEILYSKALEHGVDFIKSSYSNFFTIKQDKIFVKQHLYYGYEYLGKGVDPHKFPACRKYTSNNIWTGLYNTIFLRSNNIRFNESPGASYQDTGFSVLCAAYAENIMLIEDNLYLYRRDNDGSSVKNQEKYKCIVDELKWLIDELYKRDLFSAEIKDYVKIVKTDAYLWNAARLNSDYQKAFFELIKNDVDDSFYEELKDDNALNKKNTEQFELVKNVLLGNRNTIVFGAGIKGGAVVKLASLLGKDNSIVICDNDERKWEKLLDGVPIKAPEFIGGHLDYPIVLAIDITRQNEVYEQLKSIGVKDSLIHSVPYFPDQYNLVTNLIRELGA